MKRHRHPGAELATDAPDGAVVTAVGILVLLGLLMVYSATAALDMGRTVPPHFVRQLLATGIAIGLAAVAMRVPLPVWRRVAFPLWGISVLFLMATVVAGVSANGAQRWLPIPGTSVIFQPVEIAKWVTLIAVASMLAEGSGRVTPPRRSVLISFALGGVPAALLLLQPDLGNAVLLVVLVALLLFIAGTPLRIFAVPGALGGVGLIAYIAANPYAAARILGFVDPWRAAQGQGFQLVQSFVAFSRGGLTGVGIGDGRQKLFYLPEAHTDFILSVVAEEMGLLGVLMVLGTFAALLVAGTRIARRAHSRFAALVAFGMTALLVVPALVNVAVVTGMLPTKGLALPFLSYGRTGLLMAFVAVGVLLGVGLRDATPRSQPIRGAEPRRSWRR